MTYDSALRKAKANCDLSPRFSSSPDHYHADIWVSGYGWTTVTLGSIRSVQRSRKRSGEPTAMTGSAL